MLKLGFSLEKKLWLCVEWTLMRRITWWQHLDSNVGLKGRAGKSCRLVYKIAHVLND